MLLCASSNISVCDTILHGVVLWEIVRLLAVVICDDAYGWADAMMNMRHVLCVDEETFM